MFASSTLAATIEENKVTLSSSLTPGAISSTASDHSLKVCLISLFFLTSTTTLPHCNIIHMIDDIQNVVSLSAHVGKSLSEPANHAAWSCISFCNTSSTHSDNHHLTKLENTFINGLVKLFLTSFSIVFVAGLVHGMIHSTKSLHNSIIVFTHATPIDINLTWLSVSQASFRDSSCE
jgi:hypothetical protein